MDIVKKRISDLSLKATHIKILEHTKKNYNYNDGYYDGKNLTFLSKLVLLANKSYLRSTVMLNIIKEYIDAYPEELNKNSRGTFPLEIAIYEGNLKVIELLLDYGANIKMIQMEDLIYTKNILVIKLLAERKLLNINEQISDGYTLLLNVMHHWNISHSKRVKLLMFCMELGANPNIHSAQDITNKETALMMAIQHFEKDGIEPIKLLLEYDAALLYLLVMEKRIVIRNKVQILVENIDLLNIKN